MRFILPLVAAVSFNVPAFAQPAPAPALDPPEVRALWVDAFHAGIRSPLEAEELVAAAKQAHLNTLFVQVRRRGDALYALGVEPPLDDPAYDPAFDALAHIVDLAHREGLQVHAWVNAMPAWRDELPPRDARHVFNRHGPAAPGDENWFTASPTGDHKFPVGYFLDPGHPAAAAYLADVYVNIVRRYAVDGIHFDYIRYPETADSLPRGAGVGYNAVSLRRFQHATGRTDVPQPGDEQWMHWRREQVTNLVRRISVEAKAVKPAIRISAALIPWGQPPTDEQNFVDAAPMQRIFQDWHQWMHDGLIDLAVPMNYAQETNERVRGWFDGWIAWEKQHTHGRQLAVGLGAYRNTPEQILAQIARVRAAAKDGRADGVSFFSYAVPRLPPQVAPGSDLPAVLDPAATGPGRLSFLVTGAGALPGAFRHPAPVPAMAWIDRPDRGWIAGTLDPSTPGSVEGSAVKMKRTGLLSWFRRATKVKTDANGFYALTKVKPGRYRVWVDGASPARRLVVTVVAGQVARANF